MPQHSDSTPLDHSRKDNFAHDKQHGIAGRPSQLWNLCDNRDITIDGQPATAGVVIDYGFMDGTNNQREAVRSTIETRRKPAGANFVTWEDCANVRFHQVEGKSAQVRITFGVEGNVSSWSTVGPDALDIPSPNPTMMLSVPNDYPPSEPNRKTILHEFGHALGLRHEHQSPAFEGRVELKEEAVFKSYKGDKERARDQVLDKIQDPTNYTRFDKDSIMLYTIKREWQKKSWSNWFGQKIVSNSKLSGLDQAFIRLMYPPDLSIEANVRPFLQAMHTAGVPEDIAGKMLKIFVQNEGSLAQRLTSVRNHFNTFMEGSWRLSNPNQALLRTINPIALRRSGVNGFIGEATKNKLFQAIVKNIVYRTMEQYGIPSRVSLPGNTHNEVTRMLGALAMHDDVGHSVRYYDGQLNGKSDAPSSDPRAHGTPEEEIPQIPDAVQLDFSVVKALPGSATAHIKKRQNERLITVDVGQVLRKKALLTLNESSFNFNREDVDVKGVLYYFSEEDINTGTKARWTLEWVVFYHDQLDSKNFTAFFIPEPQASRTGLGSANEVFEHVQWKSI